MKKVLLLVLSICCLNACTLPKQTHYMQNTFDEKEAKSLLKDGKNTIKGQAFLRQQGGGIVTCAGYEVILTPATKYADERIKVLYLSDEKGYNSFRDFTFVPDEPDYYNLTKKTLCNATGNFEFKNISDGTFYIVAPVFWQVQYRQGGNLMQKVTVKNGEIKDLIITQ